MSDAASPIEQVLLPPTRDLGDGFRVRRALPARERRTIGPFVFFDQMGPTDFAAGNGLDVRPHPHIGLATMTYLFEGEILHRDSLGNAQLIQPGEVNWMVAGRGIVHSERTPAALRTAPARLSGIQMWVGLPQAEEQRPASFAHHAAATLPQLEHGGVRLRLIAGTFQGARAPVETLSPIFFVDARLQPGARLRLTPEHPERALYVSHGTAWIDGQAFEAGRMLVARAGLTVEVEARADARLLLLGGAPLDGPRYLWWNFVASERGALERAAEGWRSGRFPGVPGDDEFIPLPDTPLPVGVAEPCRPVSYP